MIELQVNGQRHHLDVAPDTPLLYVLRNDLGLKGPKYGCGLEQCGACKVLVDGEAVPSCELPAGHVQDMAIVTVEGLGEEGALHPLQRAFTEEQAIQCGYCATGMIIAAQGLLNRVRYPTDDQIRSLAFEELEAACAVPDDLRVDDGVITDPVSGRRTSYWALRGGRRFGTRVTGAVRPRPAGERRVLGQAVQRLDLEPKVTGAPAFLHDVDLPGMVHGRVVRPPRPGARLVSLDATPVEEMAGVLKVVRDGSFLGVIAKREEQAMAAAEALRERSRWAGNPLPASPEAGYRSLFGQATQSFPIVEGAGVQEQAPPIEAPAEAAQTLRAAYSRPYQMHASLGPSAAVGHVEDDNLTLWVHTQGVYPQRANVAHVLGMDETDVRVIYRDGSGCYGHNGADAAALDAALLARAFPGRPVALQWTRADEHGWEPYAPAMRVEVQASLDEEGAIVDWNHDVYSPPHLGRPRVGEGVSGLLASWYLAEPFAPADAAPSLWPHVGSHRNADPLYAFARRRIVKHHLPESLLRASSMRGLGAYANVFAIESFIDELAQAAGVDPVTFRLRHLEDERARAVIEAAAEKAGWGQEEGNGDGRGRGMAFAQYKNRQTYAAVVVDVRVDGENGTIHLERAVIAADAGEVVNPDGLSNQLEGGFVQAASQTLYEEVLWDEAGITSLDWDSYPILRFPQAPVVQVVLLNRPGEPTVGAGEAAQGPTPAAIANAIFAASGVRLREIPFTPERVKAAWAGTA